MTETANAATHSVELDPNDPDDVLSYFQNFFHRHAGSLKELLINKLKQDGVASLSDIKLILTKLGDSKEIAVTIANHRINYYKPKMAAINLDADVTHSYVERLSWDDFLKRDKPETAKIIEVEEEFKKHKPKPPKLVEPFSNNKHIDDNENPQ